MISDLFKRICINFFESPFGPYFEGPVEPIVESTFQGPAPYLLIGDILQTVMIYHRLEHKSKHFRSYIVIKNICPFPDISDQSFRYLAP